MCNFISSMEHTTVALLILLNNQVLNGLLKFLQNLTQKGPSTIYYKVNGTTEVARTPIYYLP